MQEHAERKEPPADMRVMAAALHQMYTALVQEGFAPDQAMEILGRVLAAQMPGPGTGTGGGGRG